MYFRITLKEESKHNYEQFMQPDLNTFKLRRNSEE